MRAGTGEQGVFEHVDSRAELLPEGGTPQGIHLYTSKAKALLFRKMNLAGWLYSHSALPCPEAVERLVIERDNFFRRQGLAVLGGMSVAGQQHIVALSNCPADGGIDTILCLAPGDDQAFDTARFQLFLQTRLMKRIG